MKPATSLTIVHDRSASGGCDARHAVGARLERAHVDALGGAVGDLGALAGLEVEAAERARQLGDAVDVQAHHPGERPRRAGQALKADVHRGVALRRVLLDQVREHAEARRQFEAPHHLLEQLLEPDDGVEVVGGRIQADDDVAAAVRQPLEDREQDLALVVAGAVGLNARSEVSGRRRARAVAGGSTACGQPSTARSRVITLATAAIDLAPERGPHAAAHAAAPGASSASRTRDTVHDPRSASCVRSRDRASASLTPSSTSAVRWMSPTVVAEQRLPRLARAPRRRRRRRPRGRLP